MEADSSEFLAKIATLYNAKLLVSHFLVVS